MLIKISIFNFRTGTKRKFKSIRNYKTVGSFSDKKLVSNCEFYSICDYQNIEKNKNWSRDIVLKIVMPLNVQFMR